MFLVGAAGEIPLCLDCHSKFQEAIDRQNDSLERLMNYLTAEMEMAVGLPGLYPRFPERKPRTVIRSGNITMHNIRIDNSNIGVLNSGHIGTVDTAIGAIRSAGDANAAAAFQGFTEALARLQDVDAELKNKLLELLSILATEATIPAPKRRRVAMKPLLLELATLSSGVNSLAQLYAQYAPAIAALFQ
jgi:hypothetical protein